MAVYVFFLFNGTTLQVCVVYLTGALYVHPLWFYKHQHDNRVRSKLFVACQRWWFQWRFWFVPSVHRIHTHPVSWNCAYPFEWNCQVVVVSRIWCGIAVGQLYPDNHFESPCMWKYVCKGVVCIIFSELPRYFEEVLDSSWNVVAHGDAREGKWRRNCRMQLVASTLHTTSEHGVSNITTADAHTSAASSRLNWHPRQFKWTRTFRRKTKSGFRRVPSHFNWPLRITVCTPSTHWYT